MGGLPDPDWYLDNVLVHARPGTARLAPPGPSAAWHEWWRQRTHDNVDVARLLHRQGFVLTNQQLWMAGITRQRSSNSSG